MSQQQSHNDQEAQLLSQNSSNDEHLNQQQHLNQIIQPNSSTTPLPHHSSRIQPTNLPIPTKRNVNVPLTRTVMVGSLPFFNHSNHSLPPQLHHQQQQYTLASFLPYVPSDYQLKYIINTQQTDLLLVCDLLHNFFTTIPFSFTHEEYITIDNIQHIKEINQQSQLQSQNINEEQLIQYIQERTFSTLYLSYHNPATFLKQQLICQLYQINNQDTNHNQHAIEENQPIILISLQFMHGCEFEFINFFQRMKQQLYDVHNNNNTNNNNNTDNIINHSTTNIQSISSPINIQDPELQSIIKHQRYQHSLSMFSSSLQTIQSILTIEIPKLNIYQQRSLQRQDQYIQHLLQQTEDKLLQQEQQRQQQLPVDQCIKESSTSLQDPHPTTTMTTSPPSTNLSQDELILQLLSSIPINAPTLSQSNCPLISSNQQQEQQFVLTDEQLQLQGQLQIMVNNTNQKQINNNNIFDTTTNQSTATTTTLPPITTPTTTTTMNDYIYEQRPLPMKSILTTINQSFGILSSLLQDTDFILEQEQIIQLYQFIQWLLQINQTTTSNQITPQQPNSMSMQSNDNIHNDMNNNTHNEQDISQYSILHHYPNLFQLFSLRHVDITIGIARFLLSLLHKYHQQLFSTPTPIELASIIHLARSFLPDDDIDMFMYLDLTELESLVYQLHNFQFITNS